MNDLLVEEMIEKINNYAKEQTDLYKNKLHTNLNAQVEALRLSISKTIVNIYNNYLILKNTSDVGDLESVYISYLRTAILDHSPCIQINLYDSSGREGLIDCYQKWEANNLFCPIYSMHQEILKLYDMQSSIKKSDINKIILRSSEQIFLFLKSIISRVIDFDILLSETKSKYEINYFIGEYMDKSEKIERVRSL